jgi:hypothetical protein
MSINSANQRYEQVPIKNASKFFHLTNSLTFAFPKKQADNYVSFSSLYIGQVQIVMESCLSSSVGRAADL